MSAEIIQFGRQDPVTKAAPPRVMSPSDHETRTRAVDMLDRDETTTPSAMLTETGKNFRLRQQRRQAWGAAQARTRYWDARHDFILAVMAAREWALKEALAHGPDYSTEAGRWAAVENYREAACRQMLTPAPDIAAVSWKRAQQKKDPCMGLTTAQIDRAIAADLAFLKAHPVRKARSA